MYQVILASYQHSVSLKLLYHHVMDLSSSRFILYTRMNSCYTQAVDSNLANHKTHWAFAEQMTSLQYWTAYMTQAMEVLVGEWLKRRNKTLRDGNNNVVGLNATPKVVNHVWNFSIYRYPSIYANSAYAISLICEREILPSACYIWENFAVMRFCAVESLRLTRKCMLRNKNWQGRLV
jgi:hypothetical protein